MFAVIGSGKFTFFSAQIIVDWYTAITQCVVAFGSLLVSENESKDKI